MDIKKVVCMQCHNAWRLAARVERGRLNYPLKRVGGRGENRWQQISWEDAFSEIGGRARNIIDLYGSEAIATTSGTGRTHDESRQRFFNLLRFPNHTGAGQRCPHNRRTAYAFLPL